MKIDSKGTLQLFSDYYDSFGEQTTPEELDFFLSALCLSHLALGQPCQEIIASYTERMIAELPQISFGYPGAARGERRALFSGCSSKRRWIWSALILNEIVLRSQFTRMAYIENSNCFLEFSI